MHEPFFQEGGYEINLAKLSGFLKKKQVNKLIGVKTVITLNFRNKKIIFVVFYVKDVNKLVS